MKAQLATSASPETMLRLLQDDRYACGQKVDGWRVLVSVTDGEATFLNRRGEPFPNRIPSPVQRAFTMPGTWVFDGELVAGAHWLFDLPMAGERISPSTPWQQRRRSLEAVYAAWSPGPAVRLLPVAWTVEDKVALWKRLVDGKAEGIMANRLDARYEVGKRTTGLVKCKFLKSADLIVVDKGVGGHDNLSLAVYRDGSLVVVGEVSAVTGDGPRVGVGDIVEVCYLTFTGNRLREPVTPRLRTGEKAPHECTYDQLVQGDTKNVLTTIGD